MAAFSYRSLNASGKMVKGDRGDSERHVRSKLRAQAQTHTG